MHPALSSGLGLCLLAAGPAAQTVAGTPAKVRPPASESVRFAAIGDYGTTSAESQAVAQLVHGLHPRFLITLGDNNYPDGAAATIDANIGQFYRAYIAPYTGGFGAGARFNAFFPALGNHDWIAPGALPYLDYFTLPGNERYYAFRRGPLHFFALDSDPHEPDGIAPDSVQAAWLEAGLAASDAPFKFVYMHHAPYCSSAEHGSHGELQWPFKEWGASIVLTGHDHLYERLSVSGFPYIVNGLGGRSRYDFATPVGGSALRFNGAEGALWIEADSEVAHLSFLTTGGAVMDDFVLPRGGVDAGVKPLIAAGSSWLYLDTGVDPGPAWTQLAFDDSAWEAGDAQLGYGDGDEATLVDFGGDPNQRFVTTWFRKRFLLDDAAALGALQLRLVHDDGALVYLNGSEVARANLPAAVIGPATLASAAVSGDEESTFFPFTCPAELLLARGNVLAVEIHQSSVSSSDISFDLELVGLGAGRRLLARGSAWRYRDSGIEPGAGWSDAGYDDSGWELGPAQLGYGEGDEATTLDFGGDPRARHPTTWFRSTFEGPAAGSVRWLELHLVRDDGVIVYLNGQEAARFDLPRTGVAADTYAPFAVTGSFENQFERTSLDARLLVEGTNTLAVELHNASPSSSDLSFDLELVAH